MIDRPLTPEEIRAELTRRAVRNIVDALNGDGDLGTAVLRACNDLEHEMRAYWASLECEERVAHGERLN